MKHETLNVIQKFIIALDKSRFVLILVLKITDYESKRSELERMFLLFSVLKLPATSCGESPIAKENVYLYSLANPAA
ncbi:MAG: hypothetical protein JXR85_09705, partial [Deltaproteobacteria bacterium]|nr:hypothetical protein [Deltaproteobacteria bacterium]